MKGSTIAGVLVVAGLIGGAVVLNTNEAVPVNELRPARIPCEKATKENCPGGIVEQKDFCACLTSKEALADEETDIPAAKRTRLVVCSVTDPEAGEHLVTRYEGSALPVGKDCRVVADNLKVPGISFHNVPTGIESRLEEVCAPCKISPDSWGPCPECFYRGDCDKLCKTETEAP